MFLINTLSRLIESILCTQEDLTPSVASSQSAGSTGGLSSTTLATSSGDSYYGSSYYGGSTGTTTATSSGKGGCGKKGTNKPHKRCNKRHPAKIIYNRAMESVTDPVIGKAFRTFGAKAELTPGSIKPLGADRNEFGRGEFEPSWWGALTTGYAAADDQDKWNRGHIIASRLGGPGGRTWSNMIPLRFAANAPAMSTCEDKIWRAISEGRCVTMTVTASYSDDNAWPTMLTITVYDDENEEYVLRARILNTGSATKPPACL